MTWTTIPTGSDPSLQAEWHEIVPRLWQGGSGETPGSQFDVVYTLGHDEFNEPVLDSQINEIKYRLLDSNRVRHPWGIIREFAREVAYKVWHGDTVLVRCNAGWNRSGVVVARALIEMGFEAQDAIDLIRRERSPSALSNTAFVDWLHEEAADLERKAEEMTV